LFFHSINVVGIYIGERFTGLYVNKTNLNFIFYNQHQKYKKNWFLLSNLIV